MDHNERKHTMDAGDFFAWQSQTIPAEPFVGDDDVAEDVDEPPDFHAVPIQTCPSFQKSLIRPQGLRTESLLTRQFTQSIVPQHSDKPQIRVATDISRRRSSMSIASAASTGDLTSDGGGITSPARTSTPSPPYHGYYMNLIPTQLQNVSKQIDNVSTGVGSEASNGSANLLELPVTDAPVAAVAPQPRKRCISFACAPPKQETGLDKSPIKTTPEVKVEAPKQEPKRSISFACGIPKASTGQVTSPVKGPTDNKNEVTRPEPVKRVTTIKFDCPSRPAEVNNAKVESIHIAVKPSSSPSAEVTPTNAVAITSPKKARGHSRSPSWTRKMRPTPPTPKQRIVMPTNALKNTHKPTYVAVSEDDSMSSEANRFHVFASDEHQEDDWIINDKSDTKARLTINDTLQKENVIRRLGEEVEAEVEDDEDDEDDVEEDDDEEDDEDDEENDEYVEGDLDQLDEDEHENDSAAVSEFKGIFSDHDDDVSTDGNESDNELGFGADDAADNSEDDDYDFWTPGRRLHISSSDRRQEARRSASDSSIDSLRHMSPVAHSKTPAFKKTKTRKMKILRPGTPDLPDSTDFVCGTLDEDRPAESAYVSCMEQRRQEKLHVIPQDIDPSFPTSDPEDLDEEDDDDVDDYNGSEPEAWIGHGKFEESDDDRQRQNHRSRVRKSPNLSPKRLHSPPPAAQRRLRSPAPIRRLHSPPPKTTRTRSPAPTRHHSPPAQSRTATTKRLPSPQTKRPTSPRPISKMGNKTITQSRGLFDGEARNEGAASKHAIKIDASNPPMKSPPGSLVQPVHIAQAATPFGGGRPGLSITKSLPRTPSAFCRQYRESRLRAINDPMTSDSNAETYSRGAIDIKRGLEQKNQRRAEKLHRIHCNRARKAKECEKKLLPGKGAERMRQRGLQNAGKWDPSHMGHVQINQPKDAQYVLSV